MKTLVTRSLALLLTLVLLFTMVPFTALAEAAENEDGILKNQGSLCAIQEIQLVAQIRRPA